MAAGDAMASLSLSGNLGLAKRTPRAATNFGRWLVRSPAVRRRRLSSGVFFVRTNQSSIRAALQRVRIAATLSMLVGCDLSSDSRAMFAVGTLIGAAI